MPYVIALDEGTTSCRSVIFDEAGNVRGLAQKEFKQHFPQPGWVEHDPDEIWAAQLEVTKQVLRESRLQAKDLAAIGITNQRETTVIWDRETGQPICNAIVWQDRRTAGICDKLRHDGAGKLVAERTGLVIDAYFSATKIAWILNHVANARQLAEKGRLAFGTIDTWLIWKLTEGKTHVTDVTNASRTLLFNIHTHQWDDELLKLFNVPRSLLPHVADSCGTVASSAESVFGASVPIAGIAGDQQAALFGQLCIEPGATKTTYGTGCFMLQSTGEKAIASHNQLITTIASALPGRKGYALEGSVFIGGAVVQWLRDALGVIKASIEIRALAGSVPDSGGVVFVPAFAGLGAPYWDSNARGMVLGLTRGSTAAHIARAAVEAIAHQVADLVEAMQADSGTKLTEMRVDGGAACDDLLMQLQADLLSVPLVRPVVTEITARGAAFLAGLATGVWKGLPDLQKLDKTDRRFEPKLSAAQVAKSRERWRRAVERCRNWESD
jgi:glycerol kinase